MSERARARNRLAGETSPYLLSHAANPVDWYPWGKEALERARVEDRAILLSIGYSACHWCHVMERESFENEAIAELMNRHFVCIKVDREERPDLDAIYMDATTILNDGHGGWPMTVFLTPDQRPFFAGTYFPPTSRYGRPGFVQVLEVLAQAWRADRPRVERTASDLTRILRREAGDSERAPGARVARSPAELMLPQGFFGTDLIDRTVLDLKRTFDARNGGFGGAPKFPPSGALLVLLRAYVRTEDAETLEMVTTTLTKMAEGGIYDQLGGGFMRYATDACWLVPHFEKMLYDNAQLSRVYLEAYQLTGDRLYARVARETLDYVEREMTSSAGGFFSATDADSEGEEGKYFVWTPDEVRSVLDPTSAECFLRYYDVTENGNWEGKNILNVPNSPADVARELGIETSELEARLAAARSSLYRARSSRVPPALDDKILTAWNALMLRSFARARRVLDEPRYGALALRAAAFLDEHLVEPGPGRLLRSFRAGVARLPGYLEDYAHYAAALIDLYEADFDPRHLVRARALVETLLDRFLDPETGAFFSTSQDHEELLLRRKDNQDGALPSANAVAAEALSRLALHFDLPAFRSAAERALLAHTTLLERAPRAFCQSLLVIDFLREAPLELALVGSPRLAPAKALLAAIDKHYLPNSVLAAGSQETSEHALLRGKTTPAPSDSSVAALYVCRAGACQLPVTDPPGVERVLGSVSPISRSAAGGAFP